LTFWLASADVSYALISEPQSLTNALRLVPPTDKRHRSKKWLPYSITSSALASKSGGTVKTERPGSLEVDDELKRCWLLHRQIAWMLTLEDAINILGCRPKHPGKVNSIGRESTSGAKRGKRINRGEPILARQFDYRLAVLAA
jgi:hypothetical protein